MYFYQNITISHPPNAPWHPKVPKNNLSKKVAPKMEKFSNMAQNMSPNMRELIKKKPDTITIYVFPQSLVGTVWGGRHKKPQIPHFLVFSKLPASTREFHKPPQTWSRTALFDTLHFWLKFFAKTIQKKTVNYSDMHDKKTGKINKKCNPHHWMWNVLFSLYSKCFEFWERFGTKKIDPKGISRSEKLVGFQR